MWGGLLASRRCRRADVRMLRCRWGHAMALSGMHASVCNGYIYCWILLDIAGYCRGSHPSPCVQQQSAVVCGRGHQVCLPSAVKVPHGHMGLCVSSRALNCETCVVSLAATQWPRVSVQERVLSSAQGNLMPRKQPDYALIGPPQDHARGSPRCGQDSPAVANRQAVFLLKPPAG